MTKTTVVLPETDFQAFYVIRTKAGAEEIAAENLVNQAIAVYAPRQRVHRVYLHCQKHVNCSLFNRYIFAAFKLHDMFSKVMHTRGVTGIVRFGDEFAQVERVTLEEIAAYTVKGFVDLKQRETEPEFDFAIGEVVRIISGAMEGQVMNIVGFDRKKGEVRLEKQSPIGRLTASLPPTALLLDA